MAPLRFLLVTVLLALLATVKGQAQTTPTNANSIVSMETAASIASSGTFSFVSPSAVSVSSINTNPNTSPTSLPPGVSMSGSVIYVSGYTLPYNSAIGSNFGISTTLGAYQGSGTLTQNGFARPTAAPREGWAAIGAAGAAAAAGMAWL